MADLDQLAEIAQRIRSHELDRACKQFEDAVLFGRGHDETLLCFQNLQNRVNAIKAKVDVMAEEIMSSNVDIRAAIVPTESAS